MAEQQQPVVGAAQPERRRRDRRQQPVQLLVAAHEAPADADRGARRRSRPARSARPSCPPTSPSSPQPTTTKITSSTATSSSRSASSVPTTVRLEVSGARRHQHDADRVAGARGQDVVARVADDGQRVGVGAVRLGPLVDQQPLPALRAHDGRQPVERDRADQRGDLAGGVRQLRRVLLGRPPDDAAERRRSRRRPRAATGASRRRRGRRAWAAPRPRAEALRWASRCSSRGPDQDRRGPGQVTPTSRARATAAAGPSVQGSPWPKSTIAGLDALERGERGERLLRVEGERPRHHLRPALAGQRVVGAERVARDQHAAVGQVERDVAGGVARRGDDPRAAGDVEVAVGERRQLGRPSASAWRRCGAPT